MIPFAVRFRRIHKKTVRLMTKPRTVEDFPLGYPRQAAFQVSKPSFSIYRSFNYLHARVLLELQDELRCLEEELADLDEEYLYSDDPRQKLRLMSRDQDMVEARIEFEEAAKKLENRHDGTLPNIHERGRLIDPPSRHAEKLAKIRMKLLEYDEMLVKARELAEFQKPSNRDYLTFRTWFWNKKPLSYEREGEYMRRRGDLITLRPRAEWGKFDGWIEAKMPRFMSRVGTALVTDDRPLTVPLVLPREGTSRHRA